MFKIIKNLMIYQQKEFFAAFPGVAAVGDGRLVVVFRRAPNYHGLPGIPADYFCHGDINSQLVGVTSDDNGKSWSEPKILYAPPQGGSQDGSLFYDGKYLYANSFIWQFIPEQVAKSLKELGRDDYVCKYHTYMVPKGSYVLRSDDQGRTWNEPVFPEPLPGDTQVLPGQSLRLHNRSNICRTPDGRLLLSGQILNFKPAFHSSIALYQSVDDGKSWQYVTTPANDQGVAEFEEPFIHITPSGRWVILIRCHRSPANEHFESAKLWITSSDDQGKTWSSPRDAGFHAEPATTFQLPDGRVLVTYGYRVEPFGVRARICDPELENISTAQEYIIRDDAGQGDTGYPVTTAMGNNQYLIVYYIDHPEYRGASAIEGSVISILPEPSCYEASLSTPESSRFATSNISTSHHGGQHDA